MRSFLWLLPVLLTLALRVSKTLQLAHLAARQRAKLARIQAVDRQRSHANAREVADLVPELGKHPPDLPIAAFADRNLQDALVTQAFDQLDAAAAGLEALAA